MKSLEKSYSRPSGAETSLFFARAMFTAILATGCSAPAEGNTDDSGNTDNLWNEGCIYLPTSDEPLGYIVDCDPESFPEENLCITYRGKAVVAANDAQAVEENDGYPVMKSCSTDNGQAFQSGYDWFDKNTSVGDALEQVEGSNEPPEKLIIRCTMAPYGCMYSGDGGDTWQEAEDFFAGE